MKMINIVHVWCLLLIRTLLNFHANVCLVTKFYTNSKKACAKPNILCFCFILCRLGGLFSLRQSEERFGVEIMKKPRKFQYRVKNLPIKKGVLVYRYY